MDGVKLAKYLPTIGCDLNILTNTVRIPRYTVNKHFTRIKYVPKTRNHILIFCIREKKNLLHDIYFRVTVVDIDL